MCIRFPILPSWVTDFKTVHWGSRRHERICVVRLPVAPKWAWRVCAFVSMAVPACCVRLVPLVVLALYARALLLLSSPLTPFLIVSCACVGSLFNRSWPGYTMLLFTLLYCFRCF